VARARDNFTNTAAKLIRNEFGGTVGGPVYIPKLYNGKTEFLVLSPMKGSSSARVRSATIGFPPMP
jgi:hypothetical protein